MSGALGTLASARRLPSSHGHALARERAKHSVLAAAPPPPKRSPAAPLTSSSLGFSFSSLATAFLSSPPLAGAAAAAPPAGAAAAASLASSSGESEKSLSHGSEYLNLKPVTAETASKSRTARPSECGSDAAVG